VLAEGRRIEIPHGTGSQFDHGAHDDRSGLIFVAHTARDAVEVLDPHRGGHVRTLGGHPEAAGVVSSEGRVAVTNRGDGSLSIIDALSLAEVQRLAVGWRPNGVALGSGGMAVVGDLGDQSHPPAIVCCDLRAGVVGRLSLPGQPRWCVMEPGTNRVYCAVKHPSLIVVVDARRQQTLASWPMPADGAHGVDVDPVGGRLWVACDGGQLVAVDSASGAILGSWPLPGVPDATFHSPDSGLVHVAVGDLGVIATIDPREPGRVHLTPTGRGAKTTALVRPGRLYAFRPETGDALELIETVTNERSDQ
jgi:YVTN family beta-propeller protein